MQEWVALSYVRDGVANMDAYFTWQIQVDAGIDILMADRVGLIAKALKDGPSSSTSH
jgi:hypothetical protein